MGGHVPTFGAVPTYKVIFSPTWDLSLADFLNFESVLLRPLPRTFDWSVGCYYDCIRVGCYFDCIMVGCYCDCIMVRCYYDRIIVGCH